VRAGDARFDYLLAVAALESGRENLATFILERVLAANPGHVAARLEMARAHFALRDYERAGRQLELVMAADPPPGIRALVRAYQDAMPRGPGTRGLRRWSGYLALAAGHDSNVNTALSQGSVFVPGLGGDFVPDPLFMRQRDHFAQLGGGLQISRGLAANDDFFAGIEARQRVHAGAHAFDSLLGDLHVGVQRHLAAGESVRVAVGHNEFRLDDAGYRRTQYAAAEWSRLLRSRTRLALFAQANRARYLQEAFEASSADLLALGVAGAHVLDEAGRTTVSGQIYAGGDKATRGRADGDRRLLGLGAALERGLLPRLEGHASFRAVFSDFRRENEAFAATRADRQLEGELGVSLRLGEGWFLNSQLHRTRVKSNIPLSAYSRTEALLGVRRAWD
jgi:outer membrane protein